MRNHLLAAAAAATALACGGSDGPAGNGGTPSGDIIVRNNFFDPAAFTGVTGEAVVWAWSASAAVHNVTFDAGGPASPSQSSGTFSRTFDEAGEYPYHCTIHGQAMSGTVIIEAP